jgi:thiamine transport system substrate-binding protein
MKKSLLGFLLFVFLTSACATEAPATNPATLAPRALTIMTHDSFSASEAVIQMFETQHNITLKFLSSGDAGTALNKAILSKGNPLADVFYGLDNTFLSRALEEDIFEPYNAPLLSSIAESFKLDGQNRALPIDYGDICLNYDKAFFAKGNLAPPQNLADLLKPEYRSMLVVENPASSSPGLGFLLATIGYFGEDKYLDYWSGLVENDVLVVNDWEQAYYTAFSRYGGTRPIVVSYGSSPPFEVIYAEQPIEEPTTAVVTGDRSCFRQIEFAGILKGTKNRDLAEKWLDFMLSPTFQEDIPLQMFVFPVNPAAKLDERFTQFMVIPENTAFVSPADIAAKRETWLKAWTETVLR